MVKYNNEALDATFGALSDPTRRAILARLAKGEAQVTELAQPFGMSLPAVSKHLRVLEKASLIKRHVDGRVHRFQINPTPLQTAHQWIEHYEKFWAEQLTSLGKYLEKTVSKEEK
jgi:DNA-binding transcriptional ArsR family regulator